MKKKKKCFVYSEGEVCECVVPRLKVSSKAVKCFIGTGLFPVKLGIDKVENSAYLVIGNKYFLEILDENFRRSLYGLTKAGENILIPGILDDLLSNLGLRFGEEGGLIIYIVKSGHIKHESEVALPSELRDIFYDEEGEGDDNISTSDFEMRDEENCRDKIEWLREEEYRNRFFE